jgi:hypothetical protein
MTLTTQNFFVAYIVGCTVFALSATAVFAQSTTATRITNCTQNGQQPVAVGTRVASGTYVPVADQAVITNTSDIIKNTGILVYKECVLRPIIDAQRVAELSTIMRNGTNAYNTRRNGNPLFVQTYEKESLYLAHDPEILHIMDNGTFDTLDPLYRDRVKDAIGRGYFQATRRSNDFRCPYTGLQAALTGNPQGSVQQALSALRNPRCNPIMAADLSYEHAIARVRANVETFDKHIDWGQGTYPNIQLDANGNYVFTDETVVTAPSSITRTMQEQLLTSGFRQQENANNVGEMVSMLFAGVGNQIISSDQGLTGLSQGATGGSGSFLDQVVSQSGGQLTQVTGNAALQLLSAALAVERAYNQAVSAIATNLTQTIAQLRAVERQCWASTTQAVCVAGTLSADGRSCTGVSGNNLTNIATSTQFSQAVVTNNIAALATSTAANLTKSNTAITQLAQFISTVSNNPGAQATVLSQYNQLLAQGAFHTQPDVTAAQAQQQTVITATGNLVVNTINVWAGTDSDGSSTIPWDNSIYLGTGWCNYQNQPTLSRWDQLWR